MCAVHKICIKYEITVSGRVALMEQSDLDTSVNQKDWILKKKHRQKLVQSGYHYTQKCKLPDCGIPSEVYNCRWCHTLWKLSPPPGQPRLHPFCLLANLDLFQWPRYINLRIMQDTQYDLWSKKDSCRDSGERWQRIQSLQWRTTPSSPILALYPNNSWELENDS